MTEVAWSSFKSLVQPDLPGCPWASIVEALRWSAVEFFDRSKVWRTEPAIEFDTIVGQSDYSPVLPGKISRVTSVHKIGGHYLQKIRRGYIEPWQYADNGTPREYLEKNDTTITLFPAPDAAETWAIDCCMIPDRDSATGIPDYLYRSYAEVIASGAVARLAAKPIDGATWANVEMAAYHKQLFEAGINRAMAKDMQSVAPRARPRMF